MLWELGITDLRTFVIGTVLIVLLPGPNSLFVLATAGSRGVSAGYRAALGIFLGDSVLMLLSILGVASLLRTEPMLFVLLRYAGGAYLCWLGLSMLLSAWRRMRSSQPAGSLQPQQLSSHPTRKALLLSLSNPKAILFFVSFFIQFVEPEYAHPVLSFLILGIIVQTISLLYLSLLIFTGAHLALWFRQRQHLATGVLSGVGALFVSFGIKLATATLT